MALDGCREPVDTDLPRLAELARVAIAELQPMRGGAIWSAREARREPIEEGLAMAMSSENCRVVAGTFDEIVVGYAVAHVESMPGGGRLGIVEDIFVEDGARGVGVGEAMMNELVEWCTSLDCVGIDAMALPGARQTKNFFEDTGFTARQLIMHHRIVRPGDGESSGDSGQNPSGAST